MIAAVRKDAIADFRYDPASKRYRWREGAGKNQFAPKAAVLERTRAYVVSQSNELVRLADRLDAGDITLGQFQRDAALALKQIHVSQAFLAAGGHENLNDADWLSVGRTLKKHYYDGKEGDRKFGIKWLAQDIKDGKVSLAQLRNRLKQFAASGKETYWRISAEKSGKPYAMRLLGDAEHCEQCPKYAALPPQSIADVVLPTQKCDCRSNCKCQLVFLSLEEAVAAGMKDPRNDAALSYKFSKEDLLTIKDALEEVYVEGINAIRSATIEDDKIKGIFRVGRYLFDFILDPDNPLPKRQVSYKSRPIPTNDRTDALEFEERSDKAKNCRNPRSVCGNTCIDPSKMCWGDKGMSEGAKRKLRDLLKKNDPMRAVREYEDTLIDLPYEVGGDFNFKGEKVFEKVGTEDRIDYTRDEVQLMKGLIATHNHPLTPISQKGVSFSKDDFNFFFQSEVAEFRAVAGDYEYRLSPGMNAKDSQWWYKEGGSALFDRIYGEEEEKILRWRAKRFIEGKPINEVKSEANFRLFHNTATRFAKEAGLDYVRAKRPNAGKKGEKPKEELKPQPKQK